MPKNFEDIPTRHQDNPGVRELKGFSVGQKVEVGGFDGLFEIENIYPDTEHAKVRSIADHLEEDAMDVPLDRLRKLEM